MPIIEHTCYIYPQYNNLILKIEITGLLFAWKQNIKSGYYGKYFTDIPCVNEILGHKFTEFSQDEGNHFNIDGNKWVAAWVYNNIKDLL